MEFVLIMTWIYRFLQGHARAWLAKSCCAWKSYHPTRPGRCTSASHGSCRWSFRAFASCYPTVSSWPSSAAHIHRPPSPPSKSWFHAKVTSAGGSTDESVDWKRIGSEDLGFAMYLDPHEHPKMLVYICLPCLPPRFSMCLYVFVCFCSKSLE